MPSSRSSRPASRSSGALLDPYGIYNTRTANRLRAARRRRQFQNVLVFLVLLGLAGGVVALTKWRRLDVTTAESVIELHLNVTTIPALAASGDAKKEVSILIAGENGSLLRVDTKGAALEKSVVHKADFPLHTPLVKGEIAFVPDEAGVLSAIDWQTGREKWKRTFDASLTAQPAAFSMAKKRLVVAGSDAGLMQALDADSGVVIWRVRLPAPIGNGLAVARNKGRICVLVPLLGGTAMRGGLWCLDGATGKVLWRFPNDARVEATQFAPPVAGENFVYGVNDTGAAFSVSLATGQYRPKSKSGWKTFVSPVPNETNQTVLLRVRPVLFASSETASAVSRQRERLIVGGNDGGVRGLDARNGRIVWQFETGASIRSLSFVEYSPGRQAVLVCSRSHHLLLLDAQTGDVLQRFSTGGSVVAGATASSRNIYAVTESGTLHRFALSNQPQDTN